MNRPITSYPCAFSKHAATQLSTPPLIASTTRCAMRPRFNPHPAASRRGFPAEQLHLVKWDIISVFSTRFASGRLLADVKSLSRNGPLYREPRLLGGFPLRASG